jgi:2-oxo-4-hydroxy-4-carboxy-5-ureidoimidazoline decarboxylase
MQLEELNNLPAEESRITLEKCCGSSSWIQGMQKRMPFLSMADLLQKADEVWAGCNTADALEAFNHHPKIGDLENLEKKFASTKEWAGGEQQSVQTADREILLSLAKGNAEYENKFGFIFIVCATGKSAEEMLNLLQMRFTNDPGREIHIAMAEQHKITRLRLEKLVS